MSTGLPVVALTESDDGVLVISLSDDIDANSAGVVRSAFGRVGGRRAVVDLDAVVFMDSAGLGAIIGGIRKIREAGGVVALCCGRGRARSLLTTVGMDRLVPVVASRTEALSAASQRPTVHLAQ